MANKKCESCMDHKLCMHDENLFGDVFVPGNPLFFDNKELYKKYKEWEAKGFPCEDYISISDVVHMKHGHWINEIEGNGWNEWDNLICSECGTKFEKVSWPRKYNYCPNCGAKMEYKEE